MMPEAIAAFQEQRFRRDLEKFGEQSRRRNRALAGLAPSWLGALPSDTIPAIGSGVIWGMDWSGYWNGVPDLKVFKARGGRFVLIKIADGLVATKDWERNVDNALALGLVTGGYYWIYPDWYLSGVAQAAAWWQLVKGKGLQWHVGDYEWTWVGGKLGGPSAGDLDKAAGKFDVLSGQSMWVYSAPSYLAEHPLPAAAAGRRLMIANYGVMVPANTPPWPAGAYKVHQRSEAWPAGELGFDKYVTTAADGDIYHGSEADFAADFGSAPVPPPVPDPDGGSVLGVAQERLGKTVTKHVTPKNASGNTSDLPSVPPGGKVNFSEIVDDILHPGDSNYRWLHLEDGTYVNYFYPSATVLTLQRFTIVSMPAPEPPPSGGPTVSGATLHWTDGSNTELVPKA